MTEHEDASPLDRVVGDVGQAVYRWWNRRELGIPDAEALTDLTTACEWLLQQPAAAAARTVARRSGRRSAVLGCLVIAGVIVAASSVLVGLVWLMLRVAP